jgi:hypothetical protein
VSWLPISIPADTTDLYRWAFAAAAAYCFIAYIFRAAHSLLNYELRPGTTFAYDLAMNAFAFSTSVLLALAVVFPQVIKLLGDMQPFLMSASILGFLYTLHALAEA